MPTPSLMIKTQLKDIPPWQASEDSDNEEEHLYHSQSACNDQYEYEEDDIMIDHASSMTSSPSIPDENIDFDSVYALHAFVATVEGQATANKGDALLLMEDENTYWWLVEVLHSGEIGYIPAENIETPYERLARLNKHRNVDITTPIEEDFELQHKSSAISILSRKQSKNLFVEFGPPEILEFEPETEEDEEYDGDEDEYQWEDMDDDHRYYEEDYEEDYQERYQAYDDMNNHEEEVEYQPEKVRNLLHERIKDRKLEEKQRNEIHQAINESHNISVIESTETDSDTSSDEEEIEVMMQHQSSRASLDHANTTINTRQALVRPIPAARLVDAKVVRSSLEITELEPAVSKVIKRDAMTRSRSKDSIQSYSQQLNVLRIFAGNIRQGTGFKTVMVNQNTTAQELVKQAMIKFHIEELESGAANQTEYYATVKGIDGHESTLDPEDKPLSIYQTLTAHLTTPMPSVEHIKRLSNTQIHVTRLGVMDKEKCTSGNGHFGEDSVIRFYLHRRTKRNSERVEQMYIKISLFLENVECQPPPAKPSTGFLLSKKKKYQATMTEDANRVDKIICVNMNDLVSEVIYLALDKFHITNGVPDGPQESGYIPEDLVRYRLLVQSQGSEVELNYRDNMHGIIESHRLTSRQQGHLAFILRKVTEPVKSSTFSKRHSSLRIRTGNSSNADTAILLSPGLERQRRPSILDMLMDSPKESNTSISDMQGESPKSSPKTSPKSAEKPPLPEEAQRNTVDRKYSNSSHLLSDMSESRKSSLASLLSGEHPYKSVRSTSTTPTSPLDFSTDRSRQMSLASLTSSSSIVSEDASKSASVQATGSSDHIAVERRDKTFTLSFRKIVPWTGKSKRHDAAHGNTNNHVQDTEENRLNQTGSHARPLRSTQMVDGSNERVFFQSTSYQDINNTTEKASRPTLSTASSATAKLYEPPTATEDNTKIGDVKVSNAIKTADDDCNSYATYAKWLNNLPSTDNNSVTVEEIVSAKASASDSIYPDKYNGTAAPMKKEFKSIHVTPSSTKANPSPAAPALTEPPVSNTAPSSSIKCEQVHTPELGDLSYLITNGIGFLENKESSKWEDDGGYQFHPWNRPKSKCLTGGDSKPATEDVESLSIGDNSINVENSIVPHESTSSCLASAYAKNGPVVEAKDMEQELARIVAAHIVF